MTPEERIAAYGGFLEGFLLAASLGVLGGVAGSKLLPSAWKKFNVPRGKAVLLGILTLGSGSLRAAEKLRMQSAISSESFYKQADAHCDRSLLTKSRLLIAGAAATASIFGISLRRNLSENISGTTRFTNVRLITQGFLISSLLVGLFTGALLPRASGSEGKRI